jgi:DNA-directed RNA polymerase specialized sigma24 family protein
MAANRNGQVRTLVSDEIVRAAASGDTDAWDTIVCAFAGTVWRAAASVVSDSTQIRAACRITWLRCVDHLHQVEADSIGAWLTSTAQREARRQALLEGYPGYGAQSATA